MPLKDVAARAEYNRQYRQKNADRIREYERNYRTISWERQRRIALYTRRHRAKKTLGTFWESDVLLREIEDQTKGGNQ